MLPFPSPLLFGGTAASGGDPFLSSVKLLVGFNGTNGSTTFTDESAAAHTLTANGNAQVSTANLKFGTGSGLFDGTGDYISTPDSADWDIELGWTVELFARFLTKQDSQAIIGQWSNTGDVANSAWFLYITGGKLTFRVNYLTGFGGGKAFSDTQFTWAPTLGQWYHIAADSDGSSGGGSNHPVRLYIDGAMVAKVTTFSQFGYLAATNALSIGRIGTSGTSFSAFDFNGNMDELRFTKGIARYNSDSGFTVPTAAYPRS